ncbi:beta strand repeat-containing protein [Nitrosomonas supralitoralis]|uniref:Calcium-binding protein n=1 Tax=Nitrosomonas supralitoralis TaxID=2116706 RepID=A0A2P7NUU6_9PROT|nr:hypothetical protein [Nitrosomonas supralitoralis]PSJ17244.1 hypothetical protein C7H79_09125 [Nitrosomonas supralitoralis]
MAITSTQQTEILKIVAGLFNAAPGGSNLTFLANFIENGGTTSQLADELAALPLFTNDIMGGKVTTDAQVEVLMQNFGLTADGVEGSAATQAEDYFTSQIDAGVGFGKIVFDAVTFLSNNPPEEFTETATLLSNKALVAEAYSKAASSTDLAILQTVLSKVTGDAPYTAEDVQQALADSGVPTGNGQGFDLIVGEDNLIGTSGDDTFTGLVKQSNVGTSVNTLESIDRLDGGAGNDTLTATLASTAAPSLTSVENVIARFAAGVTLDLTNATGVNAVTVQSSTGAGLVDGVGAAANLTVRSQKQDVTFSGNTATNLNLNLDRVGDFVVPVSTQTIVTLDPSATTLNLDTRNSNADISSLTGVKTLNVAARGTNEILQGSGGVTTTATITGTGSVELQTPFTALKTLDATGNSGGVTATVNAAALTINTGSGNDDITYTAALVAKTAVKLGAGDDTFTIAVGPSAVGAKVDAGDGDDTLGVTDGTFLNADAKNVYSNFETLEIGGGTGIYNMDNLPGLGAITIGSTLTGDADITNAAADTTVTFNAEEATDLVLINALTYALKTDTGTSDDVALTLNALDGVDNGTAEGVITGVDFTADGIESFTIASNISGIDPELENTDYVNQIAALSGDLVETLNISGNANLEIGTLTAPVLSRIDASTMTGGLTVDASAVPGGVEFLGGSANDFYTGTAGGDTITGNGGADEITLSNVGDATDTLIFNAASDSQLNADVDGFDHISNFGTTALGGPLDIIDVGAFGFSGQQASALANKGALANSVVDGTVLTRTDFFASGGVDRGVAIGTNGGNTYVFVDANKDGDFIATDDLVIEIDGVSPISLANFGF